MSENYYEIRYGKNWNGQHIYVTLSPNLPEGYTAYEVTVDRDSGPEVSYNVGYQLVSNDILNGGQHSDQIFGAGGNDEIYGWEKNDQIVGGNGDDIVYGGGGFDIILGDWSDRPDKVSSNDWQIPTEDTTTRGNDKLDGGDGADIIMGGSGDDQINGGPRGKGNLDDVTGGAGADLFLLNYNVADTPESDSAEQFWENFGQSDVQATSFAFFDNALEKLGELAWKAALGSVSGYSGLLLGPLGAAGGDLITSALFLLFQSPKPSEPESDDVLVIRDFDPREDVFVLPVEAGKSMKLVPTWTDQSSAEGNISKYPELKLQPATERPDHRGCAPQLNRNRGERPADRPTGRPGPAECRPGLCLFRHR